MSLAYKGGRGVWTINFDIIREQPLIEERPRDQRKLLCLTKDIASQQNRISPKLKLTMKDGLRQAYLSDQLLQPDLLLADPASQF